LEQARKALAQFLKTANSGDEFSLVAFSDRPQLLTGFTGEIEEIQNRLPFANAGGATALLDAVVLTVKQMKFAHNPRKAILIISDGGDNASRATVKEVKNLVREADVQIFAIAILDAQETYEERLGPVLLREISVQTGGQLFKVDKLNSLPEIASKIGLALRLRYVLGYAPSNVVKDGKYHKVNVKLAQPVDKLNLRLSWRLGYYAHSSDSKPQKLKLLYAPGSGSSVGSVKPIRCLGSVRQDRGDGALSVSSEEKITYENVSCCSWVRGVVRVHCGRAGRAHTGNVRGLSVLRDLIPPPMSRIQRKRGRWPVCLQLQ
jgi:hypothetical protein